MTDAPGWDAIDAALAPLYPQTPPKHFGTVHSFRLGGPDPLDGISAYPRLDPVPHWHIVSYGMSELYEKESDYPDESGWGYEFTFRPVRDPDDDTPPMWALNFLQNLARYVYGSGNSFGPGHHIDLNGPIATDRPDTVIRAAAFAPDPELGRIATPHGALTFLQIVGLAPEEYEAARNWNTDRLLELFAPRLPLLVTDLARPNLLADPALAEAVAAGTARDGSSTGSLSVELAGISTEDGDLTLVFGASAVSRILGTVRDRLTRGDGLLLESPEGALAFAPGEAVSVRAEADLAVVELPAALAEELADTVAPIAGTYRVPSAPGLVIRVEPSQIRDTRGTVVRTVG